jgi:4-amino-4-deoxy-L-arabinose transferase-like glycosyltransferase
VHGLAARPLARSRAQSYSDVLPLAVGLLEVATFVVISVWRLDTLPPVYEDEPWQASVAYKLATQGVFGSDVFAGWNGMEQHYYGFLPVHPVLMAGIFKVLGEGLLQARLEAVLAATLTLGLTLVLARRLFSSAWLGPLAVGLLLFVRWTGTTTIQVTGIPFVDLARIARYDVVVPVFGLASLIAYRGGTSGQAWRFGVAGLLAGLAALTHVYGLFWLIALGLLVLWERKGARALVWLLAGALLVWLPYLLYVLSDLPEWRAQVAGYADRFGLLDPRFYVSNLADEPRRYGPGLGPPGLGWLLRPGLWSLLVLVPLSLLGLARQALRHSDSAARTLLVPAIAFPVLFALLLRLKLVNYTLTFLPVLALACAWGILQAVDWLQPRRGVIGLGLASLLALSLVLEGVSRLALVESLPATPYATFIGQVHRTIPAGARVVGLHNYWFGFEDTEYRSFVVPLAWMDPGGLPLDLGLKRLAPDAVLLDDRMRTYLTYDPRARAGFDAWVIASGARLADQVDDPTYGLMQIYVPNMSRPAAYTEPAIGEHGGNF